LIGTILAIFLAIWVVSLVIAVVEPSFIDIDTYVFFEGLAVTMPFIIVFGGIAVGAIAAIIDLVI
jgi:hypothetical protein